MTFGCRSEEAESVLAEWYLYTANVTAELDRRDLLAGRTTVADGVIALRVDRCYISQTKETAGANQMNTKKLIVLLLHAFVGWLLCAATIGIGMSLTTMEMALVIHAVAAPIFFAAVSMVYYSKFNYTAPLATATIFVGFVMVVDFFVVGLLINRSLVMFASLLGTWIPFALIFTSTLLVGLQIGKQRSTYVAQ